LVLVVVAAAQGAAPGVQVKVLSAFPVGGAPTSAAATNSGDVVVPAAGKLVRVGPDGQQNAFPVDLPPGAFGIGPIGIAYDLHHALYVALPAAFGPPPSGTPGILKISANGKTATPVPGSEGMVAADGMGLDSSTGYLYVTDIFGGAIWRVTPGGGSAQLWTSDATNPILGGPDGVKVFDGAVYASSGDRILRIPINPDGSAGTATVWAQVPGAFFDDMTLDDRTGDVYVARLDLDQLLQITPAGVVTPIATNADGLLGAANMTLIHVGHRTVIYIANTGAPLFSTDTTGFGPALVQITIS
jgi:sugar lactone lactonase YvrE